MTEGTIYEEARKLKKQSDCNEVMALGGSTVNQSKQGAFCVSYNDPWFFLNSFNTLNTVVELNWHRLNQPVRAAFNNILLFPLPNFPLN